MVLAGLCLAVGNRHSANGTAADANGSRGEASKKLSLFVEKVGTGQETEGRASPGIGTVCSTNAMTTTSRGFAFKIVFD